MMQCTCGYYMIWKMDYKNGIYNCWYECPNCGKDTRQQLIIYSDHTEAISVKPGK